MKCVYVYLDPLEQFEFLCFGCIYSSKFLIFSIFGFFCLFISTFYIKTVNLRNFIGFQFFKKNFLFVLDLARENLHLKYIVFLPLIFYTFLLIFAMNILGMFPY